MSDTCEKYLNALERMIKVENNIYYPQYKEAWESLILDDFARYDVLKKEHQKQKKLLKKEFDEKIEEARNVTAEKKKLLEQEFKEKLEAERDITADKMLKIVNEIESKAELGTLTSLSPLKKEII